METVITSVTCKNCAAEIEQNYCPACGQPKNTRRLVARDVYRDLLQAVLGLESGWLYTIRRLLWLPGKTVKEYLEGKRKPFVKPLQFHGLMLTFYFLLNTLFEVDIIEMSNLLWKDMGVQPSDQAINTDKAQRLQSTIALFTSNIKVITSLFVPITSLVLLVFYRKARYYFTEMLVFSLYIYGCTYSFYILATLLMQLPVESHLQKFYFISTLVLSVIYVLVATYQFFGSKSFVGLVKALMAIIMSYILYFVVFILIILVYVLLFL